MFRHACYDPIRERVVAIGVGRHSHEWDGSQWRDIPDIGATRGFVYVDVPTRRLFAFEPSTSPTSFPFAITVRTGHDWQPVSAASPSTRDSMSIVHDTVRNELVAFGGRNSSNGSLADTWIWSGGAWSQSPAVGPGARWRAIMSFDRVRQRVVMFGGFGVFTALDDTWEWDGSSWSPVQTPVRPPASLLGSAAYDVLRQRTVLLVRPNIGSGTSHWEYDGMTWQPCAPLPPGLAGTDYPPPVLVYDEARGEMLAIGGANLTAHGGRVWANSGASWTSRPGFGDRAYDLRDSAVAPRANGPGLVSFGGTNNFSMPTNELWSFDGTTWTRVAVGGPPARSRAMLWTMQGATFLFGGTQGGGAALGDTWRWNGTAWSQVLSAANPPARHSSDVTVDTSANRAVLFGGRLANGAVANDTWTFDGAQWQQHAPATSPPATYDHAMGYDAGRNRIVLSSAYGTWEWDGVTWQQVVTSTWPSASSYVSMAYDAVSQRLIRVSSAWNGVDFWSFDGIQWTQMNVVGAATSSWLQPIAYPRAAVDANGRYLVSSWLGVFELLQVPGRAENYGPLCGPNPPQVTANGFPRLGDAAFGIDFVGAPGSAAVAIAVADAQATVPFFGCTLLLARNQATYFLATQPSGSAFQPLPIPAAAALVGRSLFFQGAALSPTTPNGFVLSRGLRIDVGQ